MINPKDVQKETTQNILKVMDKIKPLLSSYKRVSMTAQEI